MRTVALWLAMTASALAQTVPVIPQTARTAAGLPVVAKHDIETTLGGKQDVGGDVSSQHILVPNSSATSLPVSSYFAAIPVPVEACGAKGDGVTDDAPAIQTCGDAFGNIVAGMHAYKLATAITWSTHPVRFVGAGWNDAPNLGGTRLLVGQSSGPMITISGNARGSEIANLAVVQPQPAAASGWTPSAYPCAFTVNNAAGRVEFRNVLMAPVYDGICATSSGRLVLDGIYGQPLHRGVTIDTSYDVTHVGRVHFWPYWSADANVMGWQQQNGDAFTLGRVDGFSSPDLFVFGYRSALHFNATSAGSATKIDVGTLYADATKWPIWVQGGDDTYSLHATMHIAGLWADGEALGPGTTPGQVAPGGAALLIDTGSRADVSIDHFDASYFQSSPIQINSTLPFSSIRLGSLNVFVFNTLNDNSPVIKTSDTSNGVVFNDISIAQPPVLAAVNIGPLINGNTRTKFQWPGFPSSALEVTNAVGGVAYETPGYTHGLVLTTASVGTLTGNTWRLPAFPQDGQVATLLCSQYMASLTVVPSPSGAPYSIVGQPASGNLPNYTQLGYRFSIRTQAWIMGAQ